MATPKVLAAVTSSWADVAGAAASVAGVTWQNLGPSVVLISFTASEPGAGDAYHALAALDAYYDKNGSAHVWAKYVGDRSPALAATAD